MVHRPISILFIMTILGLMPLSIEAQTGTDPQSVETWLVKAPQAQRLEWFRSYLTQSTQSPEVTKAAAPFFAESFSSFPLALREDLGGRLGQLFQTWSKSDPRFQGFESWAEAALSNPEGALGFLQKMPLSPQAPLEKIFTFNRAQVENFRRIEPSLGFRLTGSGRFQFGQVLMNWPLWEDKDLGKWARRVVKNLWEGRTFLDFSQTVSPNPEGVNQWGKASLTEEEWRLYLGTVLQFKTQVRRSPVQPLTLVLKVPGASLNFLTSLKFKDRKTEILRQALVVLGSLGSGDPVTSAQVLGEADDLTAFLLFQIFISQGKKLEENEVLGASGPPIRPALACAVIAWALKDEFQILDLSKIYELQYRDRISREKKNGPFYDQLLKRIYDLIHREVPLDLRLSLLASLSVINGGRDLVQVAVPLYKDDQDPFLYRQYLLVRFYDPGYQKAYYQSLQSQTKELKELGILGLGLIRDPDAVYPLESILMDDSQDGDLRSLAAWALGEIGDQRVASVFITYLSRPPRTDDEQQRVKMVYFLAEKREARAQSALVYNIDPKKNNELNFACIQALGKQRSPFREPGFTQGLVEKLLQGWDLWKVNSPVGSSRAAGLWALAGWGGEDFKTLAKAEWETGRLAFSPQTYFAAFYLYKDPGPRGEPNPENQAYGDYLTKYKTQMDSDPQWKLWRGL